ncbi:MULTISPECIES: histidine kinase [unclassified Streptomyces]|uniref:sensor histidine kinase n=1 Tax=unclassified Streptomyces TaxID=2593676 RepID=UPI00047643EE|nr:MULTISPECIES: histidine kinase [unclassified Streptomyces]MYT34133.1 two-component sensor histidine kinase [Streptomyces sp. SID8354]
MSTSLRQRLRAWIVSPSYPWATGGALTAFAAVELVVVPRHSLVIAACVLLSAAILPWRRARPATAVLSASAVLVSFAAGSDLYIAAAISGLMACYTLGRHRVAHPALLVGGGSTLSLAVNVWHIASRHPRPYSVDLLAEWFVLTVAILAAVSMGDAVRAREETQRERAAAQARVLAMERRQAAEAERAAIARELHDVVAHSVSVIAVQAESATYTTPGLSPQARDGFQQIAASARASMAELRRLLGVLRTDGEDRTGTAPQPTLDGLGDLIAQHRSVGGEVELRISGDRVELPTSCELSAYRIVQEGLTNVRRHAPGAHAVVEIDYRPDRLAVRIADDGPGPPVVVHSGHGLAGMQERAALLGGKLSAGRGRDGGFLVEAEIPW